jgi:dTDP-4-dehydrorhamnose 3,5-epimerase
MRLPAGVELHELLMHTDERGSFTEIFREEWGVGVRPVQWNAVRSAASVLRGVHVHVRHADYLTVVDGRALVGLRDLRRDSPTANSTATVELRGDGMAAITIPPGVAHGFLFLEDSLHIYAVSHYWSVDDELGCRADDPDLEIEWPPGPFHLSERDAAAPPLVALLDQLEPHQAGLNVAPDAVPHG